METLGQYVETLSQGKAIAAFRQRVEKDLLASGADPDAAAEMIIALNEAIVNVVRHGYRRPGRVEVLVFRQLDALRVAVRDEAPLFDPTRVPTPDTTMPLAKRPFGGMGIHMMREFVDEVVYQQTADGRNQLTLVKYHAFP